MNGNSNFWAVNAILILLASNAHAGDQPGDEHRVWTNQAGRQSPPAILERFERSSGAVFLRGQNGKLYKTELSELADDDRERVFHHATAVRLVTQVEADVEPSEPPREEIKYGTPRKSAEDPITLMTKKEETYSVQVPETRIVRCVERYGLFGCRTRVVCRRVTTMRSESRTRTVQSTVAVASLISDSDSKSVDELITLGAPRSAGAIATLIAGILDGMFPPGTGSQFNRDVDDNTVDYQQRTPDSNGVLRQIRIEIQNNPKQIRLLTVVLDTANPGAAQTTAQTLHNTIKGQL